MTGTAIARKTAKGEDEIKTRAGGVPANLWVVLILVDRESSVAHIERKGRGIPDVVAGLDALAGEGCVEFVVPNQMSYDGLREELVQVVEDILGGDAACVMNKLPEAPASKDGFRGAASGCRKNRAAVHR